jgi:hypothetical protein
LKDAQCVRERAAMVETIRAYARSAASALGQQGLSESVLEAMEQTKLHLFIPEQSCSIAYIESLPEVQHRQQEWRIATEMLLAVADGRWPIRFAEIAIRQALKTGRDSSSHANRLHYIVIPKLSGCSFKSACR